VYDDHSLHFGRQVRKWRKKSKLSQEDLCFHAELDRSTLSAIENGKRNASLTTMHSIALALGVPLKLLLSKD
jgi:transcriptional regulator with XRE-family HTH domain